MSRKLIPLTNVFFVLKTGSLLFLFLFIINPVGSPAEANVGNSLSFRWKANPIDDYVLGYRLYYGGNSRFNANGTIKANFSYSYYIDLSEQQRCTAGIDGVNCTMLGPDDMQCQDLYGSFPSCTIANLNGHLYFALTAYNAQEESSFTPELNVTVNAAGLAAVQNTITTLLLQQRTK